MAGEKAGKTYEALVKVVFDQIKSNGGIKDFIYWNETPPELSVEPDFIIGDSLSSPRIIIMVTHFVALHASEKKSWRNLGELCEAKTCLAPSPFALNIIFDALLKENLKKLQDAAFDGQIIVGDKPYGNTIRSWVLQHMESMPVDQYEKVDYINRALHSDKRFREAIESLREDISLILESFIGIENNLWIMENHRPRMIPPTAKPTSVRRGLSKLFLFDDIEQAIKLYSDESIPADSIPQYIYNMNLAKRGIGRAIPTDLEIRGAINLLSKDSIRMLYHSMDSYLPMQNWIMQIRNSANISFAFSFIGAEFDELIDPEALYTRLQLLRYNKDALTELYDVPESWPPENVWLLESIFWAIKISSGKEHSYGYSQIAEEIALSSNPLLECFSEQTRQFLLSPWGYLSEWSKRESRSVIPDDVIKCVAIVLSNRLKTIGKSAILSFSQDDINSIANSILETKMCTYREFSPLQLLLSANGIDASKGAVRHIKSCFAEKAGLRGRAGVSSVLQINNTIINWQSASNAGKDHKKKELIGRAVGLRYTWDASSRKYAKRPGVKKLILLLDGSWTQKDVDTLVRAGWDEVFYPDEIDNLKSAIV